MVLIIRNIVRCQPSQTILVLNFLYKIWNLFLSVSRIRDVYPGYWIWMITHKKKLSEL